MPKLATVEKVLELIDVKAADLATFSLVHRRLDHVSLFLLEGNDTILHSSLSEDAVDLHLSLLSNAVGSVDSLHLDVGVPKRVKDNNP